MSKERKYRFIKPTKTEYKARKKSELVLKWAIPVIKEAWEYFQNNPSYEGGVSIMEYPKGIEPKKCFALLAGAIRVEGLKGKLKLQWSEDSGTINVYRA